MRSGNMRRENQLIDVAQERQSADWLELDRMMLVNQIDEMNRLNQFNLLNQINQLN